VNAGLCAGSDGSVGVAAYPRPVFERRIPIRYRDTDALGHVNNAVYLTYLEELLLHWLGPVLGDDFVSARVELDFRSELRHDDGEVTARASLEAFGTSSLTAAVSIGRPSGQVSLEGRVVVVAWDPLKRRSRPITEEEKEEIRRRQDS
jgi:acyl-CoA thioester hydrolase